MTRYLLFFFAICLHANQNAKYMGSLLSDPPTAIPYGHFVIRNLTSFDDNRGLYLNNWNSTSRKDSYNSIQNKLEFFFGLNTFFDLSLSTQFFFNYKGRYAYSNVGDITAGLDVQLLDELSTFPGIKFAVREVFPLGNYQLFNAKKGDIEKTGSGSFSTQLALFFYKGIPIHSNWLLNTILQVQYQINAPVTVKGFHCYGGGLGTNGKLLVGNAWEVLAGLQLFYKNAFIFSLDALYEHQDGSDFYGYPGLNFFGGYSLPQYPSSERVSLAPSFAYQFPFGLGIMFGSWITLTGRNTEQFTQYILNLFYVY